MNLRSIFMFGAFVVLPIAIGTAIYVGWRTTTLLVFHWIATSGIPADVFRSNMTFAQPLLYSLPDGCWVFAGTSWMLLIWGRLHPWVFALVVLGVGGELGQALRLVPGTFEWNDIAFYIGSFILAFIGYNYAQTLFISNRPVGHGRTCCG